MKGIQTRNVQGMPQEVFVVLPQSGEPNLKSFYLRCCGTNRSDGVKVAHPFERQRLPGGRLRCTISLLQLASWNRLDCAS